MHARRGEDYAHQQPSLTAQEAAAARDHRRRPHAHAQRTGIWATRDRMRNAERELAQQAETSYKRMVQDRQAAAGEKSGRERDTGARID